MSALLANFGRGIGGRASNIVEHAHRVFVGVIAHHQLHAALGAIQRDAKIIASGAMGCPAGLKQQRCAAL